MERVLVLLIALIVLLALVMAGGVWVEPITLFIRRRVPNFSYESEQFVVWGMSIMTAFALGLLVMYLLLRP